MYSQPMTRDELAQHIPSGGSENQSKVISEFIRQQKTAGRLIERTVFIDPAKSNKKKRVLQFVAVNLELAF
ncbi:MAG TPA: hypothetical protein VIP51_10115 [Eoetvoesiella sp.]